MLVVIVLAAVVVLAGVVFAAAGRGGQLSTERGDYLPIDLGPVSATDVALLRPPSGVWGYNMHATDEAMERIAESIRERDVRIVALEQLVTDLSRDHAPMATLGSPYAGARHRRSGELPLYNHGEQPAYQDQPLYQPVEQQPYRPPAPEPYQPFAREPYRPPAPEPYRPPEPEQYRVAEPEPYQPAEAEPYRPAEAEPYRPPEAEQQDEPEPEQPGQEQPPAGDAPGETPPDQSRD